MTILPSRSRCLATVLLAVGAVSGPAAAGPTDVEIPLSKDAEAMLVRALGPEAKPAMPGRGRSVFESVLASEAFRSGDVGCFDVHVLVGVGKSAARDAQALCDEILETLAPASELVSRHWPAGGEGLVSGTRFPVVVASSRSDYLALVELLDHCERAGYSGWSPANTLDGPDVREAEVARTWEVQVFDLSHAVIAGRRADWLAHGVGYYGLAFVTNRALRRGSWGLVPPWLSSGLADELDISAYGRAWVGKESWTSQTPGWFRSGWSGFVPEGTRPPAPVTGPPADLAVTVTRTRQPWLDPESSRTRHWSELVADLESEAPASFARAAAQESFLPRDRAAARCLMHLMLSADGGASLTAMLDDPQQNGPDGMPQSDPLPVLFARALGGVPDVDRLEALPTRELLVELGRTDLIERLEQAQAGDALALTDHREQAKWLYRRSCDRATRTLLFGAFLEIEYVQQMAEWKALGPHLDAGLRAALEASRAYPTKAADATEVGAAFRAGLARTGEEAAAETPSKKPGKRSRSR